jgi:hypothetical protein
MSNFKITVTDPELEAIHGKVPQHVVKWVDEAGDYGIQRLLTSYDDCGNLHPEDIEQLFLYEKDAKDVADKMSKKYPHYIFTVERK